MKYILATLITFGLLFSVGCSKDDNDNNNNNNNPVDSSHYSYIGTLIIELPGRIDTAYNIISDVITTSQDSIFITIDTTETFIRGALVGDSINIPLQENIDGYGRITESTIDYTLNVHVGSSHVFPRTYTGTAQ